MDVFLCFCVNLNKCRVCDTFISAQANSLQVYFYANFLQRLHIFRTLQFYCQNCLCFCVILQKLSCLWHFFSAQANSVKYVLRKLFATFTHFSDVAILLSKLLVRLCHLAINIEFVTPLFLRRQIHFKYVLRKLLQRLRISRTLQFYCRNCLCVCASFAKVLCVGKTKRRKGFLFCGANCFNFFATVL